MKGKHIFVVLAYKESPYLEECVESVVRQGSEVIVLTTTPNKHIEGVAKKYKLKVKTAKHTSIGGDFDAALRAGAKTGAELVTIAHQDDVYAKAYAKEIMRAFEDESRAQIIFTDYYEIKNGKKVYKNANLRIKRILTFLLRFRGVAGLRAVKRSALRFGDAICCPAVTFNVKKVSTPLFECEIRCDVDWFAWEKLSRGEGKFVYINKPLMGHRVHEESETSNTINDDARSKEDYEMFRKFWPEFIARKMTGLYKKSEKNNQV